MQVERMSESQGLCLADIPLIKTATTAAMRRALDDVAQARVVATAAAPFEMLGCNAAFYELMGYPAAGSTLKILHGQTTRVDALESTILLAAKDGGCHECQVRLYTACAQPLLLRVQVSVVQTLPGEAQMPEEVSVVLVSFSTANHILRSVDVKADVSAGARVVVQATSPFNIQNVSTGWAEMYGMSQSMVLGRALRVIEGPGTDSRVVRQLMDSVVRGVEGRASFMTYDVNGNRLWTHLSTAPLLAANGTIDSCVAHAVSYSTLNLDEAMAANTGNLLVVGVQGHKHITHATQELCHLLSGVNAQTAGLACASVFDSTANREVISRLVAEVVHGDTPHATPHLMTLQGAQGNVDARVKVMPVVNKESQVTHLLLDLEPGEFFPNQDAHNLREHVRQLQLELAEARAQTDAAKLIAMVAVADAEAVRQQFNTMLTIVTSSPSAEDCDDASSADDDLMDDEWDVPAQGLGGYHAMMGSTNQRPSWTRISTQTCGNGTSRKRMHQDVIEVPLVQSFSKRFEQEQVNTGFALCDSAGAILWSNVVFSQATGYTAEQVLGCQWYTFLCGGQTDCAEIRSMTQMRLPLSSSHMQLYQKDGAVVWAQVRSEPALIEDKYGALPVMLLCIHDVSAYTDGTHSEGIAGSDAAQSASARSLYQVSQLQEEAIASGLASICFISAPTAAKRQQKHPQATCYPSARGQQQQASASKPPVHAMHSLRISS